MAQGITLPVNLQLENLQTIVKDMRSQLGNLKIGSSGYEKVSKVIADIEKRIQNLQVLASRPFVDVKQFNEIQKEILHAKDDLTKLGLEAGKIKFSDISLTSEQSNKLKEFDNQLKSINDQLKQVKESAKTAFLASDAGKAWKEANPVDATKSFEAITLKIEQEVNKQETAIAKAKKAYEEYLNTTQSNEKYKNKINGLLRNGGTSLTDMLKQQGLLDKIFTSDQSRFKNNGRSILGDWLKDQFGLSQEAIDSIISESGQKVYQAFNDMSENVKKTLRSEKNRMLNDNKQKNAESNNGKTYTDAIASAEASHASAVAAQRSATEADLKATAAQAELQEQYNATKEKREESIQGIIKEAQESAKMPEATDKMRQGLEKVGEGADQAKERLDSFDKAASKLSGISNFINRYIGIYAIMRRVTTAIRNAFNNIKELDKTITNIAVVTNMSQQDLWGKIGEYTQMAQQYGVTTQNVYTVSQLFYQQGLQTSQVMELTTETLKMAKIAGMDYSAAANAMTVAIRAFKIEMSDAQSVTDTYSALAAKFAVSSAEIANAMEKTASSAANVGMSIESTSAFISVMVQTTRESAQNIGSALKSIISRYGEMKASPNELLNIDGEEVAFNKVDTALKSIGISIKDASGQFRDFDDVILELASKWDTLDNNTQRYIATIMAGNRQQSRFIALVSNYDELSRAMNVAENSENASIVQAAKTMDSLESKANQLKNAFSQLYLDLHFEDQLKGAYDWLTKIVTTVGKLGTLNGVLPTLMNIIGMGTGAKSLLGYGKEWIDKQKTKHVDVDDEEANKRLDALNEKASKPETKKVTVQVDDSQLQAMNLTLNATGLHHAFNMIGGTNSNFTELAFLNKTKDYLPTLSNSDNRTTLLKGFGINKEDKNFAPLNEFLQRLSQSSNALETLNQAISKLETETNNSANTEQRKTTAGQQAADTDENKVKSGKRAADVDEQKARAGAKRIAGESGEKTSGLLHNKWSQKAQTVTGVMTGVARIAGTVITAKGAAHEDKSTDNIETSKVLTGLGNGLSMAGTGASMGMSLGPLGAIAGAIIGFVAGGLGAILDGLFMTAAERIELAKKEAKEAKDASLKAQADTVNLSNSLDNIKKLKDVMYNSAEDMEAYRDAMSTMAEEYPELISYYDEAGRAVIDLNRAEELLLKTRAEGAAKARLAAAKELDVALKTQEAAQTTTTKLFGANRRYYRTTGGALASFDEKNWANFQQNYDWIKTYGSNEQKQWLVNQLNTLYGNQPKYYSIKDLPSVEDLSSQELGVLSDIHDHTTYGQTNGITATELTPDAITKTLIEQGIITDKETVWDYLNIDVSDRANSNIFEAHDLTILFNKLDGLNKYYDYLIPQLEEQTSRAISQESLFSSVYASSSLTPAAQSALQTKGIYSSLFYQGLKTDERLNGKTLLEYYNEDNEKYDQLIADHTSEFFAWYNNLTEAQRTLLENLDFTQYTNIDEILSKLGLKKGSSEAKALELQFIETNTANRDRILKTIFNVDENGKIIKGSWNDALEGLSQIDTDKSVLTGMDQAFQEGGPIITAYADFFTTELLEINKLAKDGYTELASTRLNLLDQLRIQLSYITDSGVQAGLLGIINNIDFSDYASISNAYKLLDTYGKEHGVEDQVAPLLSLLDEALETLVFNITTVIQGITNNIIDATAKTEEILSANKSGLSLDKALEEYTKLQAIYQDIAFEDIFQFDAALGKYTYTIDGLNKIFESQEKTLQQNEEFLKDLVQTYDLATDKMNNATVGIRPKYKQNIQKTLDHLEWSFKDGKIKNADAFNKVYNAREEFEEDLIKSFELDVTDPIIKAILDDMEASGEGFSRATFTNAYKNKVLGQASSFTTEFFSADELMNTISSVTDDPKLLQTYRSLATAFMNTEGIEHTWENWIKYVEEQAKGVGEQAEQANKLLEAYYKNKKNQIFSVIDWSKIFNGTDFDGTNTRMLEMLAQEMGFYGNHTATEILNRYLDLTYGEGDSAAKRAAREAVTQSAIAEKANTLTTAMGEILNGVADEYSAATLTLLETNGVQTQGLRNSLDRSVNAAMGLLRTYGTMIDGITVTLEQYNEQAMLILNKVLQHVGISKTGLDFMSGDIDADALLSLANTLGLKLTDIIDVATGQVIGLIGQYLRYNPMTNTYEITGTFTEFKNALEKQFGIIIDETSEAYLSALKTFNDNQLKNRTSVSDEVFSELESLLNGKEGDRINLAYISAFLSQGTIEQLEKYGELSEDGIFKITDAAGLPNIISLISDELRDAGALLPEQIAKLNDTLLNYFKSISDLISKGISGTLTHTDMQQLVDLFDLDLEADFVRTNEGLKLTHNAVLQVYNDIKKMDAIAGNITFKSLMDSLIETDEHYKTISSTLARIDELNRLIANEKPNSARRQQYEQELALAREIAAVRATTEDDSYSFMSNKIPGGLNNPLNYWNAWGTAFKAINKSKTTGTMAYEDFYNMVTEMGNLASLTEEGIKIGEITLHNSEDAAELIRKAGAALEIQSDGSVKINFNNLKKMGIDFLSGTTEMSKGIDAGIDKFADEQIKMLDSMINFLEVIVAMEQLGNIEVDNKAGFTIGDIFKDWTADVLVFTDQWDAAVKELAAVDPKSDLGKALKNMQISVGNFTGSMLDLFSLGADGIREAGLEAEEYYQLAAAFIKMAQSGDYSQDNIMATIREVLGGSGFEGEIEVMGMHLVVHNGTVIEMKNGKYMWNGHSFDNFEAAAKAQKADSVTLLQGYEKEYGASGVVTYIINEDQELKVEIEVDNNNYTARFSDGATITATSPAELSTGIKHYAMSQDYNLDGSNEVTNTTEQHYTIKKEGVILDVVLNVEKGETTVEYGKFSRRGDLKDKLAQVAPELTQKLKATEETTIHVDADTSLANKALDELKKTLDEVTRPRTIKITTKSEEINESLSSLKNNNNSLSGSVGASGTIGLAHASGTLMGELGPEMVVSNGRYFIVGQNGPEIIDLADDAIVFNHLQTKSLLEKGMSSTRGKAVTNEKNAIAFAKGNINGGPAQASASDALATLKNLRSMWEAIKNMSALDLAKAGGSGGGGGGKSKEAGFVKELERWYNYLQEIAKLEEKITYEETLRSKINSDFYKDGYEYYKSQMRSAKDLTREIATQKQLVEEQQKYFEARRKQMNDASNPFSMLYTFDEAGQLKYRDGAFAKLSELASSDPLTGIPNHSLQEQYDQLIAWGFGDYMRYDESGKEIDTKDETGLKNAIKAFWDRIESDRTEMQGLHDSIEEHKQALLKKQEEQNKILKDIEDNQISLEGKVLKAIEDAAQREIDTLSDQKEAIQEANTALIDGLTNALQKEQQMYQNQQNQDELTRLQRQLGILQRSGGSASQIRDLQKQIDEKNRDMYFNKQQEQIDAIQEASDKEIERLEQQIDLMTETLEYQKANGLLWEQVYAIMNENTAEQIAEFIKQNDAEYWAKSPTDMAQTMRDVLFSAEQWKAFAEGGGMTGIKAELDALMALLEKTYGDQQKADEAAAAEVQPEPEAPEAPKGNSGGGSNNSKNQSNNANDNNSKRDIRTFEWAFNGKKRKLTVFADKMSEEEGKKYIYDEIDQQVVPGANEYGNKMARDAAKRSIKIYDRGGMVDKDQLALVHAKEAVFTPEQTSILRNDILGHSSDSLLNLLADFRTAWAGMVSSGDYNSIDRSSSVVIEHAEVNMKVDKLANSYDAARAGKDVMEEMLHIASKTRAQNRVI